MAKPKLEQVRDNFIAEVDAAITLANAVAAIPGSVKPLATPYLHPKYKVQVVELAFMGVVASWEEFLERSLVRYVAGTNPTSGTVTSPKYGIAKDIGHAYQIISGKATFNPTSDFLKVSDPSWVKSQMDFFFSSHPFTVLSGKKAILERANKIRNRVAHNSEKCRADFKSTALHMLSLPASGKLKQSYSAGNLLLAPPTTAGFGLAPTGATYFDAYMHLYKQLANAIVP